MLTFFEITDQDADTIVARLTLPHVNPEFLYSTMTYTKTPESIYLCESCRLLSGYRLHLALGALKAYTLRAIDHYI